MENLMLKNNMAFVLDGNMKGFLINPNTLEILEDNTNTGILIICRNDKDESYPECTTEKNFMYYIDGNNNHQNLTKYNDNTSIIMSSPVQRFYINTSNNIITCNEEKKCEIYSEYENCGEMEMKIPMKLRFVVI